MIRGPLSGDLTVIGHRLYLVLALRHERCDGLRYSLPKSAAWRPWWSRLSEREAEQALDDAGFFLDHVRAFMCPEGVSPPASAGSLTHESLSALAARLPGDALLRLTLGPEALVDWRSLTLLERGGEESLAELAVTWVDAFLFPSGVGFLVLRIDLEVRPSLGLLVRVLREIRTLTPGWLGQPTCRVRSAVGTAPLLSICEQMVALLGRLEGPPHVISFIAVDAASIEERGVFASVEDRLLFEAATAVGSDTTLLDRTWTPGPDQLEGMMRSNRFAPWHVWRSLAVREGLTFLATEPSDFGVTVLPRNIEGIYLPLTIYVLHQRVLLEGFVGRLVSGVTSRRWDLESVRRHADEFAHFRHRYWLSDVTTSPLGATLYRKLLHGLDVTRQFDLAARAEADVKAFYEQRRARWMAGLLNILSFGLGPLGLAASLARLLLPTGRPQQQILLTLCLLLTIWCILAVVARRLNRR